MPKHRLSDKDLRRVLDTINPALSMSKRRFTNQQMSFRTTLANPARRRSFRGRRQRRLPPLSRGGGRRVFLNPRSGGFMGIENKYLDAFQNSSTVDATTAAEGGEHQPGGGVTGCLSAPAQGDGPQNRDGRKIMINAIFMTCAVKFSQPKDQADILDPPAIYMALVLDTQTNAATIVSENVFTNPSGVTHLNSKPLRNMENTTRYRILDQITLNASPVYAVNDQSGDYSGVVTSTSSQGTKIMPFTLSWRGAIPVTFNSGTTADVANVVDNSIHLIGYATTSDFTPNVAYISRVRFRG